MPLKTTRKVEYHAPVLKMLRQYIPRKRLEQIENWILHHDNTRRISLLLFSNIFVNATFKSCYTSLIIQISHHAISGYFQHWKKSFVVENLKKISHRFESYFNCAEFFEAVTWKRFLYLFWKMYWRMRPLHKIWGKVFWKRWFIFLL